MGGLALDDCFALFLFRLNHVLMEQVPLPELVICQVFGY
jgi:hypothetical protein